MWCDSSACSVGPPDELAEGAVVASLGREPDGSWNHYHRPSPGLRRALGPDRLRERLYSELGPLVARLIRQYGGEDSELRQDLAGEIYCRYRDLLSAYDPDRGVPLRPYLIRQLTAAAYTYARSRWNTQRREVSLEGGILASGPAAAELNASAESVTTAAFGDAAVGLGSDPTPAWDDRIVKEQLLDRLPALIQGLPTHQRQAVIWRYYEQRSFDDIAGRLGVRTATARSLLRHGLSKLRSSLGATG